MAADSRTLGRFTLDGIPPAPRGVPQVEVTFDLDANGILNVKAVDKATSKEQKITITASSGLSKEEIEKMQKDAEAHADEDKKKRETIEVKNAAESLVYSSEKALKDAGDKVKLETGKAVTEKIDAVKEALKGDDNEKIKKSADELSETIQKVGQELYSAQSKEEPPAGDANGKTDKTKSDEKNEEAKDKEKEPKEENKDEAKKPAHDAEQSDAGREDK
jgi:molecular chaperone DnaK